jgi:hypothetical protein
MIGKPRQPVTRGDAIASVVYCAIAATILVIAAMRLGLISQSPVNLYSGWPGGARTDLLRFGPHGLAADSRARPELGDAHFSDPEGNYWEIAWAPPDNPVVVASRRAAGITS